jgi:hypothetical protein
MLAASVAGRPMPYLYSCVTCLDAFKQAGGIKSGLWNGHATIEKSAAPYITPPKCPLCKPPAPTMKRGTLLSRKNIQAFADSNGLGDILALDVIVKLSGRKRSVKTRKAYSDDAYYDQMEIAKSKEEEKDDERPDADPEFEPAKNFNPAMRYTTGTYSGRVRSQNLYDPHYQKDSKLTQVAGAANRPVATSVAMAAALKGTIGNRTQLSAYSWVNWNKLVKRGKPFKTSPKESFEWCHMVADCLGGPTDESNLVAASYCANTFMLVIEQKLQSRTDLKVQVVVDCSEPYVAEFIRYTVHKGTKSKEWVIDARADEFSASDGKTYGDEVADFLK